MKVVYTPEFRRDLRAIKSYYLKNDAKEYAKKLGIGILTACAELKDCPQKGPEASKRFGVDTDMRYLVLGQYIVFYRIDDETIEIIRIFDTRTNIIFRMFGIDDSDPESEKYWGEYM